MGVLWKEKGNWKSTRLETFTGQGNGAGGWRRSERRVNKN